MGTPAQKDLTAGSLPPGIVIRPMTAADVEAVAEIEALSFSVPWPREEFIKEIYTNDLARYLVIADNGKVVGYAGMWIILDEAHVTNIALRPEYRGRGLGRALLGEMISVARRLGAVRMTLEVRRSNLTALRMYTSMGFVSCGVRPRYYSDSGEDAIIMWLDRL